MTIFSLPSWEPDNDDLDRETTDFVKNVTPKKRGWGPLPSIAVFSDALPAACRGAFTARQSDGTYAIFAATATGIYMLASQTTWDDVSRTTGGAYNLTDGHSWGRVQFGDLVIFVNINDVPQVFTLGGSTDFSALGGDPPRARFVWTESLNYVGLGNLLNDERSFRRSEFNNAEGWEIGVNGSDFQEMQSGGFVLGTAGDQNGCYVFMDSKVVRLVNQPGMEIGFTLQEVENARGAVATESVVQVGTMVFFLSEDGFYQLGTPSSPIGATRVNDFFLEDIDLGDIDQVQGVADPIRPIVWWRYKSTANSSLDYTDKLIGYNWQLSRWCYAEVNLEWLFAIATPGYSLEDLETILGYTSLETIPFSLDSRHLQGGRPALAGFDTDHKLCVFEGPAMEAIMRTSDIVIAEGRRTYVRGWRPVGDATGCTGRVGRKENYSDALSWGSVSSQSATGFIPTRASGRTVRLETTVPAGTAWKHMIGLEVEAVTQGKR